MTKPGWHDWLLETGIDVEPGSGWGEQDEILLQTVRKIEGNILGAIDPKRRGAMLDWLGEVRQIRNFLCCVKVIEEGHNPWGQDVGREEWLGLTEHCLGQWDMKVARAVGWAANLGWTTRRDKDGNFAITDAGRATLAGLTPYNE